MRIFKKILDAAIGDILWKIISWIIEHWLLSLGGIFVSILGSIWAWLQGLPLVLSVFIGLGITAFISVIVLVVLKLFGKRLASQNNPEKPLAIELTDGPNFIESCWGAEETLLNAMTRNYFAEHMPDPVPNRVYKIAVRNTSSQTIKNVSVRLLEIEGCPNLIDRLPTRLGWTDYRLSNPYQQFVDIQPEEGYFVDVVRTEFDRNHKTVPRAVVCHMIDKIVGEIPIEAPRIKIQVTGENIASDTKLFSFMNRDGERKLRLEES